MSRLATIFSSTRPSSIEGGQGPPPRCKASSTYVRVVGTPIAVSSSPDPPKAGPFPLPRVEVKGVVALSISELEELKEVNGRLRVWGDCCLMGDKYVGYKVGVYLGICGTDPESYSVPYTSSDEVAVVVADFHGYKVGTGDVHAGARVDDGSLGGVGGA